MLREVALTSTGQFLRTMRCYTTSMVDHLTSRESQEVVCLEVSCSGPKAIVCLHWAKEVGRIHNFSYLIICRVLLECQVMEVTELLAHLISHNLARIHWYALQMCRRTWPVSIKCNSSQARVWVVICQECIEFSSCSHNKLKTPITTFRTLRPKRWQAQQPITPVPQIS